MPEDDREVLRARKTRNLMIAGAVLLLLPLMGAAYILLNGSAGKDLAGGDSLSVFERREGAAPVAPMTTSAPALPMQKSLAAPQSLSEAEKTKATGGSLSFIQGGSDYDYKPEIPAATASVKTEPVAPPAPLEAVEKKEPVAAVKSTAKVSIKPMNYPKLKPTTRGTFAGSSFGKTQGGSGQTSSLGAEGAPASGTPDMAEMMKNMPAGGAGGTPDMAEMMKNMPAGGAGGTPDMSQMMKNMPGGGAGGMPDVNQMMKSLPGAAGTGTAAPAVSLGGGTPTIGAMAPKKPKLKKEGLPSP